MASCAQHNEEKVRYGGAWKCMSCNREHQRRWRSANGDLHRERLRVSRNKRNDASARFVFDFLMEHPCVGCGESDPIVLQFDHRDPTTKANAISNMVNLGCSEQQLKEEMDKCDVLCANCHTRRTARQFSWRKLAYKDGR
jgi:hypothetical protein